MKNIKVKNYIYLIVIISALAWLVFAYKDGIDLSNVKDFLKLLPKVVTVDMILIGVFVRFAWKWKIFKGWLVPFPNLNGTWLGYIYSDWINPQTGTRAEPIPAMLCIHQSFSHTNCVMHTGEMKSYSIAEGFNINQDQQIKQLSYIYTSKTRALLSERNPQHDGAMIFDIIGDESKKLIGKYWTERKTKGEIKVEFHTKKILDEIPEEQLEHPITEQINKLN
jgi:hypothetical protein